MKRAEHVNDIPDNEIEDLENETVQDKDLGKSDNSDDNNCIINTDETPAESVEKQPTAEESSAPTVCPACGQPVESGSAFCSQCGAKL